MQLIMQSQNLNDYLVSSEIVDYFNPNIQKIAQNFKTLSGLELIKTVYEFVRDEIPHSFDIDGKYATCIASEVLESKEGICFAKSHLLASILRYLAVPTGFCYQLLVFDDSDLEYKSLHGLNAVYVKEFDKWIRIDPRGNKNGVNAEFIPPNEKLAFEVREKFGEIDYKTIFINPDENVVDSLKNAKDLNELKYNLPDKLKVIK